MPKIGASITRPTAKPSPKPTQAAIPPAIIPARAAKIVAVVKGKTTTTIKLEIDPAESLAVAADAEAMWAHGLIRFPDLLAKHGINPEHATGGTAHRADEINRKKTAELLAKYNTKEHTYATDREPSWLKQSVKAGSSTAVESSAPTTPTDESSGGQTESADPRAEEPEPKAVREVEARVVQRTASKQRAATPGARGTNNPQRKVPGRGRKDRKSRDGGGHSRHKRKR